MFNRIKAKGWRRAVALMAAYALVLQAFLVYSIATQAAAQNAGLGGGEFFVLCSAQTDAGALPGTTAPVKPNTHCPICTLTAFGAAMLPDVAMLPAQPVASVGPMSFVSARACISFHRARAGLSRAPPQNT